MHVGARRWSASILAVAVVLLFLASAVGRPATAPAVAAPAPLTTGTQLAEPPGAAHATPAPSVRAATEHRILTTLQDSHVPLKYAYLPNFNAQVGTQGGLVAPTYQHSPAPYGIATYGVENTSGNASAYILNSPSYEGAITFNSLNEFYLDDDSTDYIGAQLNTVVSNITLFGSTNYSFWNQNVVAYSARSNLLQFIDNIWNFSSPNFDLTSNVFDQTSPNGTLIAPVFYYGLGPVLNVTMPFTLHLYTNATTTNVGGFPDDIVYFNYTVIKSGATVAAGTFDWAIFNSQDPANPVASIPAPMYQLNGFVPSPTGYLPYESELVFCGPGGGSTTTVLDLNATLNLWYLNTSTGTYQTVPSAYSFGTNTGETIEGATEWYDATNTVHVGPGPTLPFPLWNGSSSAAPGHLTIQGTVAPDTSFVFLNESASFNASWAAWAPVPIGGNVRYEMPIGDYAGEVLMSNFDPVTIAVQGAVPSSWSVNLLLTADPALGVYTPLIAFSNSQLAELAVSGTGTSLSPYVLPDGGAATLDPIFGMVNTFTFPVFPGLLLAHTTAYVLVNNSSTFSIDYAGFALLHMEGHGLPTTNHLQLELYGTSHVSITNASGISGWFDGSTLTGFPLASLMIWNSSSTLLAGNVFSSQGTTVLLYGGSANTIWGNWFQMDANLSDPAFADAVMAGTYAFGPQVYESGDLLFNNGLLTEIPAYSPASTIYYETFYGTFNSSWVDAWNVALQPATDVLVVNGVPLSGSIVGGMFEGGNLWWDYAPAPNNLPYDDGGLLAVGGDAYPLTGDLVTVTETGLAVPTVWTFQFDGLAVTAVGSSVSMSSFDGTFAYSVDPVPGYTITGGSGSITLAGGPSGIAVTFTPIPTTFELAFAESGLPTGTTWTVTLNGGSLGSSAAVITFLEPNGTYSWSVAPVVGLSELPGSGTTTLDGTNRTVAIVFTLPPSQEFTVAIVESGVPSGLSWSATILGTTITSQLDVITFDEPNGTYSISMGAPPGYVWMPPPPTVTISGAPVNVAVTFSAELQSLAVSVNPESASLWIDGGIVPLPSNGSVLLPTSPGVHTIEATAVGYYAYFDNVTVPVGVLSLAIPAVSVSITLHPVGAGAATTSGLTGADLALLGGVSLLALVFLIGLVYFWSRGRSPPSVAPTTATGTPPPH